MKIPLDPTMFAEAVDKVINTATPRKKEALKKKGVLFSPKSKEKNETNAKIVGNVKLALKELKKNQTKRGKQLYYSLAQSLVGKHMVEKRIRTALDIKLQYMKRMSLLSDEPIPKSDSLSSETKENIKTFFKTESVVIPDKRSILKDGRQRSIMTDSLKQAHKRFKGGKISLSSFKRNRPKEVLTMDKEKFRTCLCEYCLNVQFKIESLNRLCDDQNLKEIKLKDKYDCIHKTLCGTPKKECYDRKCKECGAYKIKEHFADLIQRVSSQDVTCKWKMWEMCTVKEVRRQVLNEKNGKISNMITELTEQLQKFAKHIFVADWQRQQFQKITKQVPAEWVVTVADFAENYRCINQDEIQSAYYNYQQCTVFPIVANYNCPKCENGIVQDYAVFISPDLIHDADAVKEFTKKMDSHIRDEIDFSHEVQFSDGCAAQFKSKKPFQNLSEVKTHSFERAFFGSRHGKNACDALGGLVKNQAEKFVRSRKGCIRNAKDLYDFCNSNLTDLEQSGDCTHKKRTFFYVERIDRDGKQTDLKTVKGTQSVHNVRGVAEGIVKVRNLSCFCGACIGSDKAGECENSQYVEEWTVHSLKGKVKVVQTMDKKTTVGKGGKHDSQDEERVKKVTKIPGKKRATEGKKVKCEVMDGNEEGTIQKGGMKSTIDKGDKSEAKSEDSLMCDCSNFVELREFVDKLHIEELPKVTPKTFFDTGSVVDSTSVPLVPEDIPMKPTCQLYPCTIYGDGNCLPRAGSLLVYGNEENFKEIRERIVWELTKNEEKYLDNTYMSQGRQENAQENVPKAFAQYSDFYMGQRLTKRAIKNLYEQEVLHIRSSGKWMGLWQLASLANILNCPVVSVCPTYGTHTVRSDMHRVFYPFNKDSNENEPVFLMWTSLSGVKQKENEFAVNHFVVLMPLTSIDPDDSLVSEFSDNLADDSFDFCNSANSSILDIIQNLISDNEEELSSPDSVVLPCPKTPVQSDQEKTEFKSLNVQAIIENTVLEDPEPTVEVDPETMVDNDKESSVDVHLKTEESRVATALADPDTTVEADPETKVETDPDTTVEADPKTIVHGDQATTVEVDMKTADTRVTTILADLETTVNADPEITVEADQESTVEAGPESTVEADPESTVETVPESTVETVPETTVEVDPESTVETVPESTVEAGPETTVEVDPESTVEADPNTTVDVDLKTAEISYKPGTYINVTHGQEVIPAVVDNWESSSNFVFSV